MQVYLSLERHGSGLIDLEKVKIMDAFMRLKIKNSMHYSEIQKIEIPKVKDVRGNLSFLEQNKHIPFKIKRVYWIYDVPDGEESEGHAFKNTNEFVIPLSGGFGVEVTKGEEKNTYQLHQPHVGLYIPKLTWRKITGFLSNSICLILSDTYYEDCEYIRSFNVYIENFKRR